MDRISAAALGMLLSALAQIATGADSAVALPAGTTLHDDFGEARGGSSLPGERRVSFDEIHGCTDGPARLSVDSQAAWRVDLASGATACVRRRVRVLVARYLTVAGATPGLSAPVDASLHQALTSFQFAFGNSLRLAADRARQDEREVLPRNSDALVRAKIRLPLSKEWRGFVYADVGAADSAFKWQGLAGIRAGHGVDLLGGWRRVTYHFSPGSGFDSLDFNGPFVGATLAW